MIADTRGVTRMIPDTHGVNWMIADEREFLEARSGPEWRPTVKESDDDWAGDGYGQ